MHHPVPPTVSLSLFLSADEMKLPEYPACLLVEQKPSRRTTGLRHQVGDLLITIGLKIKGQSACEQALSSPARRLS